MDSEKSIKIGGQAGFGIKISGLILANTLLKEGLYIFGYSEYPSLIRGGQNTYQINISSEKISSPTKGVDILVALNQDTAEDHWAELKPGAVVIHDNLSLTGLEMGEKNIRGLNISLDDLAKKIGNPLARNMIAIGAIFGLLGIEIEKLKQEIAINFTNKGPETVNQNQKAAEEGYNFIKTKNSNISIQDIGNAKNGNKFFGERIILTGNEATAEGIMEAGCGLYSAYPMTPATSILHILAEKQKSSQTKVHQAEDEIGAIGVAIGAASTGIRTATGTSGGGFALMVENIGLAAMTETPVVIIESQRPAPATGLPTWTEQGDLNFVVNAGHGEFPRIVLAPGDAEEVLLMTKQAFNWAEKFQLPVIILLDKHISESDYVLIKNDLKDVAITREGFFTDDEIKRITDYKRYEITASGISRRAVPGQEGGVHIINSDEHNEYGFSIEADEMRIKMMDKRFVKLAQIKSEMPEPILYGPNNVDLTIISWGSNKGVILDALKNADKVNFLHLSCLWPFPARRVETVLKETKNILLIENNKTGQLGSLIRQETGIKIKNKFLKYDGKPFFREEIIEKILQLQKTAAE